MTCIILASGNSLDGFDFSKLNHDILAINYMYKYCEPKYIFSWDAMSTKKLLSETDKIINTSSIAAKTIEDQSRLIVWKLVYGNGLIREKQSAVFYNGTVAFAINAAINLGYKTIYLLGCDNEIRNGKVHFYDTGEISERQLKRLPIAFNRFNWFYKQIAKALKPDEKIIAVESSITVFENMSMNEFINTLE